ncbi:MAG: hypothetical protein ACFFD6_10175 [Candidatus Thorarchaeota archaeon]
MRKAAASDILGTDLAVSSVNTMSLIDGIAELLIEIGKLIITALYRVRLRVLGATTLG